ncbi:MAG: hypothetical protein K2N72_01080 [Oscillospiraceae bacterium]|nr:hypothetical protein [Oscillospiraceae bacterium]
MVFPKPILSGSGILPLQRVSVFMRKNERQIFLSATRVVTWASSPLEKEGGFFY